MPSKSFENIKIIGTLILVGLILLIFSSKTIYLYKLPIVTATLPINGQLKKTENTKGTINYNESKEIYSQIGGKIENLYVKENDVIEKGQKLLDFSFDIDSTKQKIDESKINKAKINLDIESINIKIDKINRNIELLKNEVYKSDNISEYEMFETQKEIKIKIEDISKLTVLFNAGVIPKIDLEKEEKNLVVLKDKEQNLKDKIKEQNEKNIESIEEKEKNRKKQLLDYNDELINLNQDIILKELDIKNLDIQEEGYLKILEKYDKNLSLYAPLNGKILKLSVNVGQNINDGQLIATYTKENDFKIECDIPLDNNFIKVGDYCKLKNTSHSEFEAQVTKITPQENVKKAEILINSSKISLGETFNIKFEKESKESNILIPNGALNMDNNGYFVYQVKQRDGIIGKEFYPKKNKVYIGDSDSKNTIITDGITFFEPIILLSDKSFSENETIKLNNEGDFFAK